MSDMTRLWLLVPEAYDGVLILPAELSLAVVVAGPAGAGQGRALSEARSVAFSSDADLEAPDRIAAGLDRWAQRHAGEQCALVCSLAALQRAVGDALGVGDPQRFGLRPGGCATLDWPVDRASSDAAPALVGFDLDWLPVFLAAGRPKFPGGPGVASSSRA